MKRQKVYPYKDTLNKNKYIIKKLKLFLDYRKVISFLTIFTLVYLSMGLHLGILPPRIEKVVKELTTTKEVEAQIASDDRPILFLDPADSVPTDWTCISCTGGDAMENLSPVGSGSFGSTGGSVTHTHTVTTAEQTSPADTKGKSGNTGLAEAAHDHPNPSTTISSESNRPLFTSLQMIKYTGTLPLNTIPENVIAMFDATPPSGWTNCSSACSGILDRIIIASGSAGINGGSDTFSHNVDPGDLGASTGTEFGAQGGGAAGANTGHTHTVGSTTSDTKSSVPQHASLIFAKADAGGASSTTDMYAFFDATIVNTGEWTSRSGSGEDLENDFIEASTSVNFAAGGSNTHNHANTSVTSGGASAGTTTGTDVQTTADTNTHTVDVTGFSTEDHRPQYKGMIIAESSAAAVATFVQNNFQFFVDNDALKPTDIWGNPDLAEKGVITAVPVSNDPPEAGDELRIRMNVKVETATLTANSQAFELRAASASSDCSSIANGNWSVVAASTSAQSSVRWQFGEAVTDKTALESGVGVDLVLSDSTVSASYSESNPTANNPNEVPQNGFMEWDFVIKMGDLAEDAKTYCFRMEKSGGAAFATYNADAFPKLETRPGTDNLLRHGNFFVDEKEKGFFWAD